jgi:asparagine synthase (glutamine-hydrolysing)
MRLICGVLHLDGAAASEELLRAMAAQMDVKRLRPSLGLWRNGPVGFAVLDFSARGMAASALPELGTSTIAADVRLDEPLALARKLDREGAIAEDALLLAALERFGPDGLDQVLGDFALASWNKATQRLVCARDVFGIRPLAYVHQPGRLFAFASLPKALHGSGIVPKKIDEDALARCLIYAHRADDCLVAGIKRLPPAHFLEISRAGMSLTRYWQLDRAALGTKRCSPDEAARELRRLVDEAVKCRLPRNKEIGAHLSGGLDSSAIAVLAARRLREEGRSLHAYSFLDRQRNDITLEDETEFVKAVLEQERDIDWMPIRPPVASPAQVDADKMTSLHADEPENAVCRHAEEQGVGLVLSGWGGDEGATFNGRGAFAELFLRGRWRMLAREVLALKRQRGWSVPRIINWEIIAYLRPEGMIGFVKRIIGRPADLETLLRRSLSKSARRRLAASGAESNCSMRMAPDGRENRWRLMTDQHVAERADIWAQIGARYGLALTFPLLDRRVVEFSLSLPSELFLRGGFRRRAFRDAMVDVLPERVRLRHQKYQPFPSRLLDLAESKNEFLARIDAFEQNESVRRMIDIDFLRRQLKAFPPPEKILEEMRCDYITADTMMNATLGTVMAAEYLDQHGDQASTRHGCISDATINHADGT